jgi:AraC-like DNA-binding protein
MKVPMRAARETIRLSEGHSFRLLRWARSLSEVECVLAPERTQPLSGEGARWHFHVEMELTLFTRGAGTRFVGDHIGAFGAGDLVLLGEKLPHYWHCRGASSGLSAQWHFPESHALWTFPETLSLLPLFERAKRGLHITGKAAAEAGGMLEGLQRSKGAGRLALLLGLLHRIAEGKEGECQPLSARAFSLPPGEGHQRAIAAAVRHLVANHREMVRLEELLSLTGLSRSSFARQFKQHSGRSFSEFLNGLRLEGACRELRETLRPVLDIALASGFTQVSFFNRLFRRTYGCSPSAFRSRAQATTGNSVPPVPTPPS